MNARMFALAVCCIAAAGLAGCANEQHPPPPPAPPPVANPSTPPPPAIPPGLTPAQQRVAQLQTQLNATGAHLTVDGRMGPQTRAALKAFQQEHNLKVTGRPDAPTMKALGG
jgi:peptidoglycan hydrolase-like protein with peptidoglycan-binding domain